MPPIQEKSSLKRARESTGNHDDDLKKARRFDHLEAPDTELKPGPLLSPVTRKGTGSTDDNHAHTISPQVNRDRPRTPISNSSGLPNPPTALLSPPRDTQAFSQFIAPPPIAYEVEDEEKEGVWGYLIPTKGSAISIPLVLKPRASCPVPEQDVGEPNGKQKVSKKHWTKKESEYEKEKSAHGVSASGYLIGRHPECDRIVNDPTVSNRHCLIWSENRSGDSIAVVEDLSGNGTYVNDALLGRNNRRELHDADEISIVNAARFIFRYPRSKESSRFQEEYSVRGQLGKGHFATVYLALEKTSGRSFAVKKFERRRGTSDKDKSKTEALKQEIAVLMSVSHPNLLCLKKTFDEPDGVFLVLELAPEGELFNWIVMKHKLTEVETRKVFIQLFQGIKYLHERNIVHRDIKPENILVIDKSFNVKLADFGLAKIIGEESFTTTLCGTPSYVAPEILVHGDRRRYTRAVDVWSLGVVLYICLCGFPPFSDELYHPQRYPYTLSEQIKQGKFDFPQPYWDSVSDEALYLIDRMIEVDMDRRITVDECLEHPWITQRPAQSPQQNLSVTDSTDGLTGALAGMDVSPQRRLPRERTLLAALNDVRIDKVVPATQEDEPDVTIYEKTPAPHQISQTTQAALKAAKAAKEENERKPDADRDPGEFIKMGGKADPVLFDDNNESVYPEDAV